MNTSSQYGEEPDSGSGPRRPVAGLLLAAGLSTRFPGRNKLLVAIDGVPMVRRCAESLLEGGAKPVICVTGHDADAVAGTLEDLPVAFVHNPRFAEGMSTSVTAGIRGLPDCAAAVIMLGDMPWVPAGVVRDLISAFEAEGRRAICVPTHDSRRGNPVLWPAHFFDSILSVAGDRGARGLLERFSEHVVSVPVATDGIFRDLDDPASFPSAPPEPDAPSWPP
ncbi:MAG: nucleotidyltransferase family protein [Gemmatimonadetes bacterium]|nr:nucleotidyltransferase family protein [Gemmatimonadota bacterium]